MGKRAESVETYVPKLSALLNRQDPGWSNEWSRLYDVLWPALFRVNMARKGCSEYDAEEIASMTIERIYKTLHSYSPLRDHSFWQWVRTISFRLSTDYFRAKYRREETFKRMDEVQFQNLPTLAPNVIFLNETVMSAVNGLNDSLRGIFVMHHMDGITIPQVARTLRLDQSKISRSLYISKRIITNNINKFII
jgi:RNA polymerase sigma factor (sigma-70 family)